MDNKIKIVLVISGILLIIVFVMHNFFQKVEIVEVGEIPKAYKTKTP